MDAGGGAGADGAEVCCLSYNQDCTSLAIGMKTGYKLFSLSSVEQLDLVHESYELSDVYIVERLFSSSLVVVVSNSKPRQMNVFHFKKGTEICNYNYSGNILSIRLNRQRLVVCLEESIYIHNIKDMKLLRTLLDTPRNTSGLCALSINHSNSYLAYPGSASMGEIMVYDANVLKTVCTIQAHDGSLAAIAFNSTGTKLASASEKGTVIRVFSIPEGQRLCEFRRGMKRYVSISSLVFSIDSQFLCVSSNTETVHIFKLEHLSERGELILERLHGQDVHGSFKLPPSPGVGHHEPRPGICNCTAQFLRAQECLHSGDNTETSTPSSHLIQWPSLYLQPGPTGWGRVRPNKKTQPPWFRKVRHRQRG
ncbi:WD repeat domain phosphoinositide-interacting protein 1 isoform X3 [Pseudophryne corroboree]|uniref:WD repeat domain phosphoinositide-interacting protein 1 isoform X3 n=1 Tax=Pseudophryne corroboree TaxID=495146 RepID=UPI0030814432